MLAVLLALVAHATATLEFKYGDNCIVMKPFYRLWSVGQADHFYTTDAAERDNAIATFGYASEGEIGCLAAEENAACGELRPLFRMWNPTTKDHFYTISVEERDNHSEQHGYQQEGSPGVCAAEPACGATVPLHRLWNNQIYDHFYTTDENEANVVKGGQPPNYLYDGIACYLWKENIAESACSVTAAQPTSPTVTEAVTTPAAAPTTPAAAQTTPAAAPTTPAAAPTTPPAALTTPPAAPMTPPAAPTTPAAAITTSAAAESSSSTPTSSQKTTDYCNCDPSKTWLDIVTLIDVGLSMGDKGDRFATAAIQSALAQLNLTPNESGIFYSRAALVAYSMESKLIAGFNDLKSQDDIFKYTIDSFETTDSNVNLTKAIDFAMEIFNDNNDPRRVNVKQVIVVAASALRNIDVLLANQFKQKGGVIIVLDYVQEGNQPSQGLEKLSSPGYYLVNNGTSAVNFTHFVDAFCDVNCFCSSTTQIPYAISKNLRNVPYGGCYDPSPALTAIQPAAENACKRPNGFLATIHDSDKEKFTMGLFPSEIPYWIGLRRYNGEWKWNDNSTEPLMNFADANAPGDCVYSKQTQGNSSWFQTNCYNQSFHYICQSRPCDSTFYCFSDSVNPTGR